jgi:hypothetical protein
MALSAVMVGDAMVSWRFQNVRMARTADSLTHPSDAI